MENAMAFLSSFANYVLVYLVFITAIVIAIKIGAMIRKNKNAKEVLASDAPVLDVVAEKETDGE